jgi:hypothetical protein
MVTLEEFRSLDGYADLRTRIGEFLRSDAGMYAMRILRDRGRPADVPVHIDAITSVRRLSYFSGYNVAVDDFELMGSSLVPQPEIESSFEANETDHERMPR